MTFDKVDERLNNISLKTQLTVSNEFWLIECLARLNLNGGYWQEENDLRNEIKKLAEEQAHYLLGIIDKYIVNK